MTQGEAFQATSVLIADDDPVSNVYCTRVLRSAGFRCLGADHGAGAIAQALLHLPALVLMDLHFPDMSGLQAAQHIATHWPAAHQPCRMIAVTAGDDSSAYGLFAATLVKPFRPETLLSTVADTLAGRANEIRCSDGRWANRAGTAPGHQPPGNDGLTPLALFERALGNDLRELDRHLNTLDWPAAGTLLHRIRGASSLLGFGRIAALCQRLQQQVTAAAATPAIAETYYALMREAAIVRAQNPYRKSTD